MNSNIHKWATDLLTRDHVVVFIAINLIGEI